MTPLLVAWLTAAAAADCPEPVDTTDLERAIAEAEHTFASLEVDAFKQATDRLRDLLPCLEDPLTRQLAADVHRWLGVRAFGDRDPEASAAFAAARSIDPDHRFPPSMVPPGNPLLDAWAEIDLGVRTVALAPPPAAGSLQFDARTTLERPVSWPTLFQRLDADGAVVETAWLRPDDPLPAYPVAPLLPPVALEPRRRTPLLVGAVVAGVVTGVTYGLAGASHAAFEDPSTPPRDLGPLRDRTNGLVIASVVGGAATVGLGAAWVVTLPPRAVSEPRSP